jgi:type I restriction enzyme S subunit
MKKFSEYYSVSSKNGLSKSFVDDTNGVKIVNMKELFGYNPITDNIAMRTVQLTNSELDRFQLKHGDLLFGRRSLVYEGSGKTTIFKGQESTIFESSIIRVRLDPEKADHNYVNHYFNSSRGRGIVLSIVTGAAVFGIRGSDLSNIKVDFPNLTTQKKIASILSAYDDLIENNSQRIQLLEDMTEEIYKEWFIRFRFPGYQDCKFFDLKGEEVAFGSVGALPEGWVNGTIGNLYEVKSGYAFKSTELGDVGAPVIKIRNINDLDIDLIKCDRFYGDFNKRIDKFLLVKNDLLIAMTGATIGKISLFPIADENYYLNQRVGKFFPKDSKLSNSFIYQFTKTKSFREIINNYALGAAQPNISGEQIENIKIAIPEKGVLEKYYLYVDSIIGEVLVLKNKNKILKETRSLLLPRLISGKLSVEDLNLENVTNMAAQPESEYKS